MNMLDVSIVISLVAAFAGSFMIGLWRAVGMLVALYIGLIGADIFGSAIGGLLHRWMPGVSPWTADLLGYLIALAAVTALALYLLTRSFRGWTAAYRRRFDYRGGMPLMIATILVAGLLAIVAVTVLVKVTARTVDQLPQQETPTLAMRQFEESSLSPTAIEISDYIYGATGSWVPGSTPSLLAPSD